MSLLTEDDLNQLRLNGQPDHHGRDWPPVVRATLRGSGCVWLLTEILPDYNERFGYGLADYGTGTIHEGYIDLAALDIMADPLGFDRYKVQRDDTFVPRHPISTYWLAAMMHGFLTNESEHLQDALQFMREQQQAIVTQIPRGQRSFLKIKPT